MIATNFVKRLTKTTRRAEVPNDSATPDGAFVAQSPGLTPNPAALAAAHVPQGLLVPASTTVVQILSRPGCHLCVEAEQVVAEVCAAHTVEVEIIDLEQQPADIRAAWSDFVPVVIIDQTPVAVWQVSAAELTSALTSALRRRQDGDSRAKGEHEWR